MENGFQALGLMSQPVELSAARFRDGIVECAEGSMTSMYAPIGKSRNENLAATLSMMTFFCKHDGKSKICFFSQLLLAFSWHVLC